MKIAYDRLAVLLLIFVFVFGILPLVTGAVHTEESISGCGFLQQERREMESAVSWSFEGLALLLSACGALVRQVFRIRNG